MIIEVQNITYNQLETVMNDLIYSSDIRTYDIKRLNRSIVLSVNKDEWLKSWEDVGFELNSDQLIQCSFQEELRGMGYKKAIVIIH